MVKPPKLSFLAPDGPAEGGPRADPPGRRGRAAGASRTAASSGMLTRRGVGRFIRAVARPEATRPRSERRRCTSVEEARAAILAAIPGAARGGGGRPSTVALGRVLARDVVAAVTLPPWDNSAMDGYAILAGDVEGRDDDGAGRGSRSPARCRRAAWRTAQVEHGSAIRIATGAPIPEGADAVVPVEQTTPLDASGGRGARGVTRPGPFPRRSWSTPGRVGAHVRRRGSDLVEGATILTSGSAISPAAVALAAGRRAGHGLPCAAGRASRCSRPATRCAPRARTSAPAGIPDANGPGLRALVEASGAEPIDLGIAPDDLEDVVARLRARPGRRRGRDRRRRWRVRRAVRRREAGLRGGRRDRAVARRRPARQAVRVRYGAAARTAAARCCSGCRATQSRAS